MGLITALHVCFLVVSIMKQKLQTKFMSTFNTSFVSLYWCHYVWCMIIFIKNISLSEQPPVLPSWNKTWAAVVHLRNYSSTSSTQHSIIVSTISDNQYNHILIK